MKRILPFLGVMLMLAATFTGCAQTTQINDLSRTSYIEVRAFSNVDRTYADYVIKDAAVVDDVCATLQSLTLQKVKITEPLGIAYQLTFYDHAHRKINVISVVFGNYLDYDGDICKILSDCNVVAYLERTVSTLTPVSQEGGTP